MYRLEQDIEGKANTRATELQSEFEKPVYDDLQKCRARVVDLEVENEKLYAQLSIEDDLGKDDLSDNDDDAEGIPL